ncbi:MAG TPA: hypothetical protein VGM92_05610, partial [Candidatus Kapabacteria bacterium]
PRMKSLFFIVLASLTLSSGLRSQYRYTITHNDTVGHYAYAFTAVDCFGSDCTAGGMKTDLNLGDLDSGKYQLMFFRSTDGGISWQEQNPNLPPKGNHASFYSSLSQIDRIKQIDALHAVAIGQVTHGFAFRFFSCTSDGGVTWLNEMDSNSKIEFQASDIDFSDTLNGIATGPDKVTGKTPIRLYTTHDGGATWKESGIIPYFMDSTWALTFLNVHAYGANQFAAYLDLSSAFGTDSVVYRTVDSWQTVDSTNPVFSSFPDTELYYIAFQGIDTMIAMAGINVGLNAIPYLGLFRSEDGGSHWSLFDFFNILLGNTAGISNLSENAVFLTGLDINKKICVSYDHGFSWDIDTLLADDQSYPSGQNLLYDAIAPTGDGGAVAIISHETGLPISSSFNYLSRIEKVVSGVKEKPFLSSELNLFPNPALNSLTMRGMIGPISLLDPLGRTYSVPRNGNTLDVSSLPAGIYFIVDGGSTTGTPHSAKFVKE